MVVFVEVTKLNLKIRKYTKCQINPSQVFRTQFSLPWPGVQSLGQGTQIPQAVERKKERKSKLILITIWEKIMIDSDAGATLEVER